MGLIRRAGAHPIASIRIKAALAWVGELIAHGLGLSVIRAVSVPDEST